MIHNKLHNVLLVLSMAASPALVFAQPSNFEITVLRHDLAELSDSGLLLRPDPEPLRVISPASVLLGVSGQLPTDEVLTLEMTGHADSPAAVEMQAIYNGKTPILLSRRVFDSDTTTVRWNIPKSDDFTSATISLRGDGDLRLEDIRMVPASLLSVGELVRSTYPEPLQLESVLSPVAEGKVPMRLYVPTGLKGVVYTAQFSFLVEHSGGTETQAAVPIIASPARADLPWFEFVPAVPTGATGPIEYTLSMTVEGRKETLAAVTVDPEPTSEAALEIPWRGILSYSAIVRNGELAIYTSASSEATPADDLGVPDPASSFSLHVGDGSRWIVNEELNLIGQAKDWVASAPLDFTAGHIGQRHLGIFTSVFMGGYEGMSVSSADASLRLFPSAKNPVHKPEAIPGKQPVLWRGNAFFELNGSMMVVGIERRDGAPSLARALTSTLQTRWVDLGPLPLPGLAEDAIEMSSWRRGDDYFLLSGPKPQLFKTTGSPLRGWEPVEFHPPEGWHHLQILDWDGGPQLFGIVERGGRGVVFWTPLSEQNGAYTASAESIRPKG